MRLSPTFRKIIFFLSFSAPALLAYSQPDIIWGRQFGSDKDQYVLNHVVDRNGNIFIAGKTTGAIEGINHGQNDGFLVKYDGAGNMLWKRQFGSDGDEDIQWSAIDESGSVYITGLTTGSLGEKNSGREDAFIVKYDNGGKLLWTRQFGTDSTDAAKGICVDSKGFVYVTGMTLGKLSPEQSGAGDAFLAKFDGNGKQVFVMQFGTPAPDMGYSVTAAPDGYLYIAGSTWGDLAGKSSGMIDCFIAKFSTDGKMIKSFQAGTDGFDIPMDIKVSSASEIYLAGNTSGNFGAAQLGEGDAFLLKMDMNGKMLWNSQFGTPLHDGARSVAIGPGKDPEIFTSGLISLPPGSAFVRAYGSDGTLKWEKIFEGTGHGLGTSGKDVTVGKNGDIIHVGLTGTSLFSAVTGTNDIYVVKLRSVKR